MPNPLRLVSTSRDLYPPRPFLKWAGGKGRLIQQYQPYFPKTFDTYYEPFLGGGAIFFHLLPPQSILMDINPELVNVYECIRDQVEQVIYVLEKHARSHSPDYYYQMRATQGVSKTERAARLIYLNRTCFNGLYRENSRGMFNVPMGRYKNPQICNALLLRSVSQALRHTQLYVKSFDAILELAHGKQDFVYFDPPYHPISATSNFTAYNRYSFHPADQVCLHHTALELAQRGVSVMLSNSDCDFIRNLYQDFHIYSVSATRAINSNAQKRGKITELLITSYSTAH